MRLINDREAKPEIPETNWLAIIHFGFLFSLGMFTFVLSFLPLFKAQTQLSRNATRLSILIGSLFSIFFFEMSPLAASLLFVNLLILEELISKDKNLGHVLLSFSAYFLVILAAAVLIASFIQQITPIALWTQFVETLFLEMRSLPDSNWLFKIEETPEAIQFMLWNFPFIVLSLFVLLVFFSVFFASKLKWTEGVNFQIEKIETFRWPRELSIVFVIFLILNLFLKKHGLFVSSGIFYFLSVLMLIQGFLTLYYRLSQRKISVFAKIVIYSVSFLFAFYVLIGLGAVSPWIKERRISI